MRRYLPLIPAAVLAFALPACETGGEPRILTLTGTVRDYFTDAGLPGVGLSWDAPGGQTVTSTAGGAYTITGLAELEILFIRASLNNYRATRNEAVVLGRSNATADLAVVATADVQRQYTAVGITPVDSGAGTVFVNLIDAAGNPHTGIPIAGIFIADTSDEAVGLGPWVFGSGGDIVSTATLNVTTEFDGRSRIAFLNVPAGTHQLRIPYDDGGTLRTKTIQVVALDRGVTLIRR
jgi:hypothetical protein